MITAFLKWMYTENLVNLNDILRNDDNGFHARFRIQKCMFIAQNLGLNAGYSYNSYKYGPYSPSLASDYCEYARRKIDTDKNLNFDEAATCRDVVGGHDDDWLEIATTLIHASARETKADSLIDYVECIKYPYPKKYIQAVFADLLKTKLAGTFDKLGR